MLGWREKRIKIDSGQRTQLACCFSQRWMFSGSQSTRLVWTDVHGEASPFCTRSPSQRSEVSWRLRSSTSPDGLGITGSYRRQYQSWWGAARQFCLVLLHIAQAFVFHMEARACPTCSLFFSYITGCMNVWLMEPCAKEKQIQTVGGESLPNSLQCRSGKTLLQVDTQTAWKGRKIRQCFLDD